MTNLSKSCGEQLTENFNSSYDAEVDPVKTYSDSLSADLAFYERVRDTKRNNTRKHVYSDVLKAETGNSFLVKAGQVIRIEQRPNAKGNNGRTQIMDVLMVTTDLAQYSDHLNSTAIEGFNQRLMSGIWSQSRHFRKMATLVEDEFPYEELEDGFTHIWLAAHCSPEYIGLAHGLDKVTNSCHENFMHAFNRIPAIANIQDEKLRKEVVQYFADRNDWNIFQGNQFMLDEQNITRARMCPTPPVKDGTAIEWYAEQDMYVVISNCPYGDQHTCYTKIENNDVFIEVFDTGIEPYAPALTDKIQGWAGEAWKRVEARDSSLAEQQPLEPVTLQFPIDVIDLNQ
ncbi:DUF1989 domain-containing protein [Agarivorans sp. Alg241-V36]|uniref:DUF1989 domain-containing protein n=1 Tax=Agarivorans sp. Alg241-V36 TaxID=2305992 RepID=UPI0013D3646F|nr:DUF1989 domain-containing protein [Agarivorans sp. Alg241-V36]